MDHIHHTHQQNILTCLMKVTPLLQWTTMGPRQKPMVFHQIHMAPRMPHHQEEKTMDHILHILPLNSPMNLLKIMNLNQWIRMAPHLQLH